jgi:hypothetical protein
MKNGDIGQNRPSSIQREQNHSITKQTIGNPTIVFPFEIRMLQNRFEQVAYT